MDKIEKIITEKYWWREDYLLKLDWCRMAMDEGTEVGECAGFMLEILMGK